LPEQSDASKESAVIGHAIKALTEGGELKFDIPHRIYKGIWSSAQRAGAGRQPLDGRGIRSQWNRSEDTIRAIREGCRGAPADVVNPAGLDDPRCRGSTAK
jgi:hypothetical protein